MQKIPPIWSGFPICESDSHAVPIARHPGGPESPRSGRRGATGVPSGGEGGRGEATGGGIDWQRAIRSGNNATGPFAGQMGRLETDGCGVLRGGVRLGSLPETRWRIPARGLGLSEVRPR